MTKLIHLFRFIRPVNLLIMALTQLMIKYFLLDMMMGRYYVGPFPNNVVLWIIVSTILIASAGNLYNDLRDVESDRINKPHKKLITDVFSPVQAAVIWKMFMILGLVLGVVTSFVFDMLWLSVIYIVAVAVLIKYSSSWKGKPLIGNLTVSLLPAMSILLVIFAADYWMGRMVSFERLESWRDDAWSVTGFFMAFAFLTSFIREVIKDLEDMNGDASTGLTTLAVKSPEKAKGGTIISMMVLQLLMLLFIGWSYMNYQLYITATYLVVLFILCYFLMFRLIRSNTTGDFHLLSRNMKVLMVLGMLSMILIWNEW